MYSKRIWPRRRVALAAASLAAFLALCCQRGSGSGAADAGPDVAAPPRRGERIVIEPEAAEFLEVRVLEVTGDRVTIQLSGGDSKSVALADVYRLEATRTPSPGSMGICRASPDEWVGCRIVAVHAGDVQISVPGKGQRHVASDAVITPTAVTELNIKRRFERARDREAFLQELAQCGAPRAPAGWKPSPAEQVLARIEGRWLSGKIFELGKKDLRIDLVSSGRVVELPRSDVIPAPPYSPAPRRGEYALARPMSPVEAWTPVRVEAGGDTEITARDATGARRVLTSADLVPLGR